MVSTFWFKNFCDRFLRGRVGLDGFDRLIIMLEVCLLLQSIMGFSLIDFFGLWDFLSFAGGEVGSRRREVEVVGLRRGGEARVAVGRDAEGRVAVDGGAARLRHGRRRGGEAGSRRG